MLSLSVSPDRLVDLHGLCGASEETSIVSAFRWCVVIDLPNSIMYLIGLAALTGDALQTVAHIKRCEWIAAFNGCRHFTLTCYFACG
ncbi:hypothetical protein CEXT_371941 [Caerostris extrusa]|uniref:Uncharacterized protein n=1 Tax=Caerostris extrusa TaxID=172846 RepID=A0AAV4PJE1_CAEEX|nr:hypothetical protein CEXT_371941 [Caerostris extrusa]